MFCSVDDLTIHYRSQGEGRPLLLLHGLWLDHHQMVGCIEPGLAGRSGWKRYYIDLPGMGRTPAADWISSSDQMLDVLCDFIDAVLLGQRFTVGGYSYGGYLALGLVHRMPSRIDGLMLVCPMVKDLGKRDLPQHEVRASDPGFLAGLTPEERDGISWSAVQTERVFNRVKAEMGTSSTAENERFLTRLQEQDYTFSFDINDTTEPFEKPTLVVTGRQDSAVGYKDVWQTLDRFPMATYAVLDRAGHELPISQDKLLDVLLGEWLDRVEEAFYSNE